MPAPARPEIPDAYGPTTISTLGASGREADIALNQAVLRVPLIFEPGASGLFILTLDLLVTSFADAEGNPIPDVTLDDGIFFIPEPSSFTLIALGMLEFEQIEETNSRLVWAASLTLLITAVLLYLATASVFRVGVVMLAAPFSLVGAVWVGMIALAGLDAETGLVMLLYLDNSTTASRRKGECGTKTISGMRSTTAP